MLAWMYFVPLALFWIGKGRVYYLSARLSHAPCHGRSGRRTLARPPATPARLTVEAIFFTGLAAVGAYVCALVIPLAPSGPLRDFALRNNGDLREEIGWDELVRTVAGIRDSLPPDQQASLGIIVGNYGEQGAIEMLGPAYHLPLPISMTNSRGCAAIPSRRPRPSSSLDSGKSRLTTPSLTAAWPGITATHYGIKNEESLYHQNIYVCGPPLKSWPDFWKAYQSFG